MHGSRSSPSITTDGHATAPAAIRSEGPQGIMTSLPIAVSEDLAVRTHCPYCAYQCGMLVGDGTSDAPAGVQGDPYFPVNNGQLCIKGWTSTTLLRHPERLTSPLVRHKGELLA